MQLDVEVNPTAFVWNPTKVDKKCKKSVHWYSTSLMGLNVDEVTSHAEKWIIV